MYVNVFITIDIRQHVYKYITVTLTYYNIENKYINKYIKEFDVFQ